MTDSVVGEVRPVSSLEPCEREEMFSLLRRYFLGVTPDRFERDLAEKQWVILLRGSCDGALGGFSTLMRLEVSLGLEGRRVVAFFSGDTVVDRAYRSETELPRRFARHVFALAEAERRASQNADVYWFLICSGYKTYRFLPVFFREFYPTHRRPTPAGARRVLDALGAHKFSGEYDAAAGVVRPRGAAPLRPGVATVDARLLRNPDVAYFVAANPGHAAGDELACLAELRPDNLTRAGRRMLYGSDAAAGDDPEA